MADVKWIKIVTDIFDDEKIMLIESLPEADSIIVIWFKLLCLAGKTNNGGVFLMSDRILYTEEMLATIFRRNINTVRLALTTFEQFGMIEIVDGVITIPNWGKHQTLDQIEERNAYMRKYMQEYREKQKAKIECKVNSKVNSKSNSKLNVNSPEEDIDKDKDIDKDNNTPLTPLGEWDAEKHTNVQNYDHLMETEMNEVKNTQLLNTVREWLAYKDGRKPKASNHYQLQSIRTLTNKVFENAKDYGTDAVIAVINESMANNYSGITWNELLKRGNPKQSNRYSFMDD